MNTDPDPLADWLRDYRQIQPLMSQEHWQKAQKLIEQLQSRLEPLEKLTTGLVWTGLKAALQQMNTAQEDLDWQIQPHAQLQCWLAQTLHHQEKTPEAIRILRELLANSESQHAEIYHLLSRYLLTIGQTEAAIIELNQALQADIYYLPAYEDLTYLANLHLKFELSFHLLQMGLSLGFSQRLWAEWRLACTHPEAEAFRTLFLDLALDYLTPETQATCLAVIQDLYLQAEYNHSEYLSFQLLQIFPNDPDTFNLHLLSAMQLEHWAPVIQLLKEKLKQAPQNTGWWYRLGIAYSRWEMPLLARYALGQALKYSPAQEILTASQTLLAQLPDTRTMEECIAELLKESLLAPEFAQAMRTNPEASLEEVGINWTSELSKTLKDVFF
jgi:tetratricopeptide (TPR) repeat protein